MLLSLLPQTPNRSTRKKEKKEKNSVADHPTHRRILASPDTPAPSSMDPILKRHLEPTSNHITTSNPDPTTLYKYFNLSSKPNSNDKVTSSLTNQKPTSYPPSASTDAHLQVKGMSLSADLDTCRITFIKPKHHQKLKTFDPRAEKNTKANGPSRQKVEKLSSHEWVEEKRVEEVRVSEKKMKEADAKVKMVREPQDPVESVDKKKMGKVFEKKREEVFAKAKGSKGLNGLIERPPDIKRVTASLEVGRRRSCSDSQVELADFLAKNGARVVSVDMPPFMQIHAVDCARNTCDKS